MIDECISCKDKQEEEISLYEFEVNDIMVVHPKETIHIPGIVTKGETIAVVHANDREKGAAAVRQVQNAYTVAQNMPEISGLIKEVVDIVPMNNTNPVFI